MLGTPLIYHISRPVPVPDWPTIPYSTLGNNDMHSWKNKTNVTVYYQPKYIQVADRKNIPNEPRSYRLYRSTSYIRNLPIPNSKGYRKPSACSVKMSCNITSPTVNKHDDDLHVPALLPVDTSYSGNMSSEVLPDIGRSSSTVVKTWSSSTELSSELHDAIQQSQWSPVGKGFDCASQPREFNSIFDSIKLARKSVSGTHADDARSNEDIKNLEEFMKSKGMYLGFHL